MGIERELKFSIDQATSAALPRHALLQLAGSPNVELLATRYFDTDDGRLAAAGMVLRLRRHGGQLLLTVKSAGSDDFGTHRGEWEWAAVGAADDALHADDVADAWARTPLHELADDPQSLGSRLQPVFGTAFERSSWLLTWGGSRIELALDRGHCLAQRQGVALESPLLELELEVKDGALDDAWELAWALAQDLALRISPINKAQRAAALAAGQRPGITAAPARGKRARSWLASDCAALAVWGERVSGADAVDDVHQLRATARRLRSALAWCDDVLPASSLAWFDDELRWTMQLAGSVRDADVLLPQLPVARVATAQAERARARAALQAYLLSPRWGRLLLALARWSQQHERERSTSALRQLAARVLPRLLQDWSRQRARCREPLRRAAEGRLPSAAAIARLHRLRIRTKQLRLGCERLAPWLQPRAAAHWSRLGDSCAMLQTALGHWHDAERLRQALVDSPAAAAAAGRLALQALAQADLD